nr:MAG TPA: hypothetical protein [Caudoviricetes sp.]
MASYNGSIDLLALNGAQVFTGIDQQNPTRAFVCVPVDLNEIRLTTSRNDATKQIAGLRVNIWPLHEEYKNAVRRKAQERGDNNVNVPTHEMQISYTTEYVKYIAKSFPKLVEKVKEQKKERDPSIVTQDVQDENSHLFKALRNRMNKRLAILYQPQNNAQKTAYPQQAYNAASNATAYVAPANNETTQPQWGANFNEEDLPF